MVISGRAKDSFDEANIIHLREKYDPDKKPKGCLGTKGMWTSASVNEDWEHFWLEIQEVRDDVIVVDELGELEIQEDDRGEYVEAEQQHNGLFARGNYMTRFRPFLETGRFPQDKEWLDEEGDG